MNNKGVRTLFLRQLNEYSCWCWKGILAPLLFVLPLTTLASPTRIFGHTKTQIESQNYTNDSVGNFLGPERPIVASFDNRLGLESVTDNWTINADGEFLALVSDGLSTRADDSASIQFGDRARGNRLNDSTQLFDLSKEAFDTDHGDGLVRFDRLSVSHTTEHSVVRIGRQAISWGNGIAFHTLDLFNPFSPSATDKEYKSGQDMFYGQGLFDSGADVQLLGVPRRDPETHEIEWDESSVGAKLHFASISLATDFDLLAGNHYSEALVGVGATRELWEGVARLDLLATEIEGNSEAISLVANYDRSWTVCNTNVYGFVEYFYTGVGTDEDNYANLPSRLTDRIGRGELFTLGRNYLALGSKIEATPLHNLLPSIFLNLEDQSGLVQARAVIDILQDLTLNYGVNIPFGGRGSEFGGIELANGLTAAQPISLFARIGYYF